MQDDKELILVAEDDLFNFMYIEEILTTHGYSILHARTGEEVIDLAKKTENISSILMDIKMPIYDGYQAYSIIREFNKNVPIIAQTAYALPDEIEKILDHGFNDVITKPIKVATLLQALEKQIS